MKRADLLRLVGLAPIAALTLRALPTMPAEIAPLEDSAMLDAASVEQPIAENVEWAFGDGAVATPWYRSPITQSIVNAAHRQAATTTLWVRESASHAAVPFVADARITTTAEMAYWIGKRFGDL